MSLFIQIVVTSKLFQAICFGAHTTIICSAILSIHPSLDTTNSGGCVPIRLHHSAKKELQYKVLWVEGMLGQVFQTAMEKGLKERLTETTNQEGFPQGKGFLSEWEGLNVVAKTTKIGHTCTASSQAECHLGLLQCAGLLPKNYGNFNLRIQHKCSRIQMSTLHSFLIYFLWMTSLTDCIFGSWVLILIPLLYPQTLHAYPP